MVRRVSSLAGVLTNFGGLAKEFQTALTFVADIRLDQRLRARSQCYVSVHAFAISACTPKYINN